MTALYCGPSFAAAMPLSISLRSDPISTSPAGTITISGQFSHSLKTSLGLSAHSSDADKGPVVRGASVAERVEAPAHPEDAGACSLVVSWPTLAVAILTDSGATAARRA